MILFILFYFCLSSLCPPTQGLAPYLPPPPHTHTHTLFWNHGATTGLYSPVFLSCYLFCVCFKQLFLQRQQAAIKAESQSEEEMMEEEPEEWSVAHSDPLDWITIERDVKGDNNGPQPTEEEIKSSVRKGLWDTLLSLSFVGLCF